jgi:prepilin-type processing-associated H-X9-DG protein
VAAADLDDCTQEVWVTLLPKLATLQCGPHRARFLAWLSVLVRIGTLPIGSGKICTSPGNPTQECVFTNILVLGHTGPENTGPENVAGQPVWVDTPDYRAASADAYRSRHSGGCNFLFCDGSVRFLKETINPRAFAFLATRADGEIVDADGF